MLYRCGMRVLMGGSRMGKLLPYNNSRLSPTPLLLVSPCNFSLVVLGGELPAPRCYYASCSYCAAPVLNVPRCSTLQSSLPTRSISTMATNFTEEKAKYTPPDNLKTKYTVDEIHRYMVDCMMAVGTPRQHAAALADVLVAADNRGHYSHGLNRLVLF
ncbi:hypothetical protein OTU49_010859 [Cherax quadricarinatus]|uniref:Malate dehydrogenase n=1 Tax=Cherax quadricarinatus TaxID=27406 RepID=A0AAW0WE02_CHEQU